MQKPPIKYNPAFLTDEELINAFIVRHDDLDLIMAVIRENTNDSNQHVLVIGPRGIGKTMLVLRIALAIRRDERLCKQWYPLVFAEESYEVGTAGEFWLESLFHLGRQTGDPNWIATYNDLKKEPVEDRLRERARAQLLDFADKQGKRILLIVENLNMILSSQITDDHAWKLRGTLMHEPRLMLLATAMTQIKMPEATHTSGKAMFELFKSHVLKPLNNEECHTVWQSVTGQKLGARRIRAVRILTGGNPRLLAIISHFGVNLSFSELMQEMTNLVDDHTDYFKSHLDSLPSTERKVYVTLADLWDPSTARQVALASRYNVSMTSSLLKRLVGRGAVIELRGKGRIRRYQVAERLYNVYYLMRRRGMPSERVKAIVQFMVQFYEETELVKITKHLAQEACLLPCGTRQYHYFVFEGILKTTSPGVRSMILHDISPDFLDAPDSPVSLKKLLSKTYTESACPCDPQKQPDQHVNELMEKGRKATLEKQYKEAESIFRKVLNIDITFSDAWIQLGRVLDKLSGRKRDVEQAFRKATEVGPTYPCTWDNLGSFLLREENRNIEAENAFREAIKVYPDCCHAWLGLACLFKIIKKKKQEAIHAYQEAEKACERLTQKYPDDADKWQMLAGIRHQYTQQFSEAEYAYRKAIELDPKRYNALGGLGQLLRDHLNKTEEAKEIFKKITETDSLIRQFAWVDLALVYIKQKNYTEVDSIFHKAIDKHPESSTIWICFGDFLYEIVKQYTDAEAAYRKGIDLNPNSHAAWFHYADLLHKKCNQYKKAEDAYLRAIKLKPGHLCPRMQLIELVLKDLNQPDRAFELAKQFTRDVPDNPSLLNGLAWLFFENRFHTYLSFAEEWSRRAVKLKLLPECIHTLACILACERKTGEAIQLTRNLLEDSAFTGKNIDSMMTLFTELTSAGIAAEAFGALQNSQSALILEPIGVALQRYIGMEVYVAPEISDVADDVLIRFKENGYKQNG